MGVCWCIVVACFLGAVWFCITQGWISKLFRVTGGRCFSWFRWVGVVFFGDVSGNRSGLVGHGLIQGYAHLVFEEEGVQTLVVVEGEANCRDDVLVAIVNFFDGSLDVVKVAQVGIGVNLFLKIL